MQVGVELAPQGHISPFLSSLAVDGLGTLGLLALVAYALVQSRRLLRDAALARSSYQPDAPLTPGERVVAGTVERAQGARHAVRVEVNQEGEEAEQRGRWVHTWTETGRRMIVEPFYLRHASGRRIRVEAGLSVRLVDAMEGLLRLDLRRRMRFAELTPGEHVYAHGALTLGADPEAAPETYRAAPQGLILGPPPGGRMLLCSEPLDRRFLDRARLHREAAFVIAAAALFFHMLCFDFHARRWMGEPGEAQITQRQVYAKNRKSSGYRLELDVPALGATLYEDVSVGVFHGVQEGQRVPIRLVRSMPQASALGTSVTVHAAWAFVSAAILVIGAASYRWYLARARPWYERRLVDHGSGRLAETMARAAPWGS